LKHLTVTHRTTYRYAEPVSFGPHRMMLRPRDSHELRLISASLTTSLPADLIWTYDIFGNEVCTAHFSGRSNELTIESFLDFERFASAVPTLFDRGTEIPFPPAYSDDERVDLGARLTPAENLSPAFEAWALDVPQRHPGGALSMLTGFCEEIRAGFVYETRFEQSTRHPNETFELQKGACRDFAALFIAAVRRLGFGARFVSGYLFDPPMAQGPALRGIGATHAWAEVYLPGVGWIEFDPTNGLFESDRLIPIAVTREPYQAMPIAGSFVGSPNAFIGLWVGVDVDYAAPDEPIFTESEPAAA